jgi:hypothetical protein
MNYGDNGQPHDPVDPAPSDQSGYGTEPGYGEPSYGTEPGYGEPGYLQGPSFGQGPGQAPGPYGGGQQPYGGDQQYVPYGSCYGQPPASGRPPTHLPLAVVSLLFCWPASIVAIIYASQVKNKWLRGDQQGALNASKRARTWAIVSFAVGILAIIYLIAVGHTTTGQVG